jgi:NhaA family Na+:H+ antiporter
VAFGIMPLFAFANAGVPLGQISFEGDAVTVFWGVAIGLVAGKPIGILALPWAAARLKMVALPRGVGWPHVGIVGMVGGIGFTMALFIAQLAFPPGPLLETAKLAILCGSAIAGLLGVAAGYRILRGGPGAEAAASAGEAEMSTSQ